MEPTPEMIPNSLCLFIVPTLASTDAVLRLLNPTMEAIEMKYL
jgi:hypothetical protein